MFSGGKLIFENQNLHLQAENILISDGGLLQVNSICYINVWKHRSNNYNKRLSKDAKKKKFISDAPVIHL